MPHYLSEYQYMDYKNIKAHRKKKNMEICAVCKCFSDTLKTNSEYMHVQTFTHVVGANWLSVFLKQGI